jgi:hypothetical protein
MRVRTYVLTLLAALRSAASRCSPSSLPPGPPQQAPALLPLGRAPFYRTSVARQDSAAATRWWPPT